ncbi:pilus assembly protein CpaF [[Clostridium] fimetarium]|uniref:Pilus assembly protein CpaF n=1 Tax=[Clostridium] fimetarium TaxID=99656 RepID=A0A1I0RCX4_9FIRM|nr:ATPase, T2SS/T4P/T4SS family [[Clostridium] fimetarium]SEW38679.1 pilus assembly protein CpaF [[Clostridium] fimetarium]
MNTGHDGSLSTGHSNSPKDMLSRLETMVLMGMDMPVTAIRAQIASAIDIIVHLGRLRDKTRRVLEIVEVLEYKDGTIGMNVLYRFIEYGEDENKKIIGELVKCGDGLVNTYKLQGAGIKEESI